MTNFVIPERWNLADGPQERWRERQGDAPSSEAREIVATLFDHLRDIVDISADASILAYNRCRGNAPAARTPAGDLKAMRAIGTSINDAPIAFANVTDRQSRCRSGGRGCHH